MSNVNQNVYMICNKVIILFHIFTIPHNHLSHKINFHSRYTSIKELDIQDSNVDKLPTFPMIMLYAISKEWSKKEIP